MDSSSFEMCRCCGNFNLPGPQKMIPLFGRGEYDNRLKQIRNVFIYCWELQLAENDGSPQHICPNCFEKFDAYIKMRAFSRQSQSYVKNLFARLSRDHGEKCVITNMNKPSNEQLLPKELRIAQVVIKRHKAIKPPTENSENSQSQNRLVLNDNKISNIKEGETNKENVLIGRQNPNLTTTSGFSQQDKSSISTVTSTHKDITTVAKKPTPCIKESECHTKTIIIDLAEESSDFRDNERNEFQDPKNDYKTQEPSSYSNEEKQIEARIIYCDESESISSFNGNESIQSEDQSEDSDEQEEFIDCKREEQTEARITCLNGYENSSTSKENVSETIKELEETFKSLVEEPAETRSNCLNGKEHCPSSKENVSETTQALEETFKSLVEEPTETRSACLNGNENSLSSKTVNENSTSSKENVTDAPKDFKTLEEKFKSLVCFKRRELEEKQRLKNIEFVAMPPKVNKTPQATPKRILNKLAAEPKKEDRIILPTPITVVRYRQDPKIYQILTAAIPREVNKSEPTTPNYGEENYVNSDLNSSMKLYTNDQSGIDQQESDCMQDNDSLTTSQQILQQSPNDNENDPNLQRCLNILMKRPMLNKKINIDYLIGEKKPEKPIHNKENGIEVLFENEISDPEFEEEVEDDDDGDEDSVAKSNTVEDNVTSSNSTQQKEVRKHTCALCLFDLAIPTSEPVIFDSKEGLDKHLHTEHYPQLPYTCTVCLNNYKTHKKCRHHITSSHKKQRSICWYCGLEMNSANMRSHLDRWHTSIDYECEICGKKFENVSKSRIVYHKKWHNEKKQNKCKVCGKITITSNHLRVHMLSHTKDYFIKCEKCDKGFRTQFDKKIHKHKVHGDIPPVKCLYCAARFSRYEERLEHMKALHDYVPKEINDKKFTCEHCEQIFQSKHSLRFHQIRSCPKIRPKRKRYDRTKKSTGGKIYSCEKCPRRFKKESALQKHLCLHDESRRFECADCKLKFKTNSHLEIHKRTKHTNEQPYSCKYCGKKFAYNFMMKQHVKLHEGYRKVGGKTIRCAVKKQMKNTLKIFFPAQELLPEIKDSQK